MELDTSANIISYEEYHPFGVTSYRSGSSAAEVSLKKYKYVGMERDDETGLYYYGARYYAAWMCRFISVDLLKDQYPYYTPYQYAGNKPITFIDLDGMEEGVPYQEVKFKKDAVKAFRFSNSTMTPFIRKGDRLSEDAKSMDKPNSIEFSINAQFLEFSWDSLGYVNQGQSYANSKFLGGMSQPGWFYISSEGQGNYSFGAGDPPANSENAIGGGRPLIINGLPYGEGNIYSENAPGNLPRTGPPGKENQQYLLQRNALYFPEQNDPYVGKSIIAFNSSTMEIMIIVQLDNKDGYSLDQIRNYLIENGFDNALSFDGSNSAFLMKDKTILVVNSDTKDENVKSGVTFSIQLPEQ